MVSIELKSSKAITFVLPPPPSFTDAVWLLMVVPSFCQKISIGESPLAIVQVNVILSPCWRLDVWREKGTIFGATIFCVFQKNSFILNTFFVLFVDDKDNGVMRNIIR